MGKCLNQWREDSIIRSMPVIAGGSDEPAPEPQAIVSPVFAGQCTLNGDVTGNNFAGNYMCLNLGLQLGNPSQYAGRAFQGGQVRMFGGFGTPPPGSYPPNPPGGAPMPATYQFATGDFYFQADTGSVYWFSGSTWIKTGTL